MLFSQKRLVITLFLFVCFVAEVCAKEKLTWGGFVFVGGDADRTNEKSGEFIQENFPQTWKIVETSREVGVKPSKIDNYLLNKLSDFNHNKFELEIKPSSKVGNGVVFALDNEIIYREKIGEVDKITIELSGQIIVFDWNAKVLIASFPVVKAYLDEGISDSEVPNLVLDQYLKPNVGFLDLLITQLREKLTLASEGSRRLNIGVENVIFRERIIPFLPERFRSSEGQNDYKTYIANQFTTYLSKNQNVATIPYARRSKSGKERNITILPGGANMALNVNPEKSTEAYMIKLPDPDYSVDLTLRGFEAVTTEETEILIGKVYGSYLTIKSYQRISGRSFLEEKLKNGLFNSFPKNSKIYELEWFRASLLSLFEEFTNELGKPTTKWCKSHGSGTITRKNMESFRKKVIMNCKSKI